MDKIAEIAARENVREFARNYRTMADKGLVGAELTVPEEIIGVIMQDMDKYSKLYNYVTVKDVKGTAKEAVMGTIPEAVWQDACAALNELDLTFRVVDVGAWKVGGYIPTCNALATDNDIDLLRELADTMGGAIGYALDYAIVYGDGQRQPKGAATDLERIDVTGAGASAIAKMIRAASAAKGTYSRENRKLWLMNADTLDVIRAAAMYAAGTGIVGGILDNVITLNFIPDGEVIAGYFDLYLLAERQDVRVRISEDARFIEDETVVKATARYDGVPVIPDGFARIGITATDPQPGGTPEPIAITANGTYTRDEGYSPVTVDVPSEDTLEEAILGTLGDYENGNITSIYAHTFRGLRGGELSFPEVTEVGADRQNPTATMTAGYAFYYYPNDIILPNVRKLYYRYNFGYSGIKRVNWTNFVDGHIQQNSFYHCPALENVVVDSTGTGQMWVDTSAFAGCTRLTSAKFTARSTNGGAIAAISFSGCSALETLILDSVDEAANKIFTLSSPNAFENTPIANGAGYVYVPDALVSTYKAATNWTTYADQIRGISEL